MTRLRFGRLIAPVVIAATLLTAGPQLAAAAPVAPAGVAAPAIGPCQSPPIAMANWWKDFGWPRNPTNHTYRFDGGERTRYIDGSETYKNVSDPKLPAGNYNSYDVTSRETPSVGRDAQRLVREAGGWLYFTADHYGSWCSMGGGW